MKKGVVVRRTCHWDELITENDGRTFRPTKINRRPPSQAERNGTIIPR